MRFSCPGQSDGPFSLTLSCAPLACVAHLYLEISIMHQVKRFEKGSRVWDANHLLPQAGIEKRKASGLSTHYRCKARPLQIQIQAAEVTCPASQVSKWPRNQGCLVLSEPSNGFSCEPHRRWGLSPHNLHTQYSR